MAHGTDGRPSHCNPDAQTAQRARASTRAARSAADRGPSTRASAMRSLAALYTAAVCMKPLVMVRSLSSGGRSCVGERVESTVAETVSGGDDRGRRGGTASTHARQPCRPAIQVPPTLPLPAGLQARKTPCFWGRGAKGCTTAVGLARPLAAAAERWGVVVAGDHQLQHVRTFWD